MRSPDQDWPGIGALAALDGSGLLAPIAGSGSRRRGRRQWPLTTLCIPPLLPATSKRQPRMSVATPTDHCRRRLKNDLLLSVGHCTMCRARRRSMPFASHEAPNAHTDKTLPA
jgi:hypothetical protein